MTTPNDLAPVDLLVLARVIAGGEKGVGLKPLGGDVGVLIGPRLAGSDRIARSLDALAEAGLVEFARTKKGAVSKVIVTDGGRRWGSELFGLAGASSKVTWDVLKKGPLAALALGLPVPQGEQLKKFSADAGYKVALLRSDRGLPSYEPSSRKKPEDALIWKLIGIESEKSLTLANIKSELLGRELKRLALSLGAKDGDTKALREASLRAWINRAEASEGPEPDGAGDALPDEGDAAPAEGPAPEAPSDGRPPLSLDEFARRVDRAARDCPTGRFGPNKVFIAHVWRAMADDPDVAAMGEAAFKQRLAEANNARLIDLSRADLVPAMDPADVRASEVGYHGAAFHFIRIDS